MNQLTNTSTSEAPPTAHPGVSVRPNMPVRLNDPESWANTSRPKKYSGSARQANVTSRAAPMPSNAEPVPKAAETVKKRPSPRR
jgi:hypothetical protein